MKSQANRTLARAFNRDDSGIVMFVAIFVLLIGTIAAFLAQQTMRTNQVTGNRISTKIEAGYGASGLIALTLSYVRNYPGGFYSNDSSETTKLYNYFDPSTMNLSALPDCEDLLDWTDPSVEYGTLHSNAVNCNVFGSAHPDGRVILVRWKDHEGSGGYKSGLYLGTAIKKLDNGSFSRIQFIIAVPLTVTNMVNVVQDTTLNPFILAVEELPTIHYGT